MSAIIDRTQQGMAKAQDTNAVIMGIAQDIRQNAETSEEISSVSGDQMMKLTQLQLRLEKLFNTLTESSSRVHTTNVISKDLYQVTEELRKILSQFNFNRDSVAATEAAHEKRQHPRANNQFLVYMEIGGRQVEVVTADLSLSGLRMRMQKNLPVTMGDVLTLHLKRPDDDMGNYRSQQPLELRGKVIRLYPEEHQMSCGIQFVDMSSDQKEALGACLQYFNKKGLYSQASAA
jgi:hypothetical protein